MINDKKILFCGGDRRMLKAARCFISDGFKCSTLCCSFSDANDANIEKVSAITTKPDIVILPIPSFTSEYTLSGNPGFAAEHLFESLHSGTQIFGALIPDFIYRLSHEYNLTVYDYGAREDFALLNAIPTAEGAIIIAVNTIEKSIFNSEFTVLGYGRIGKALSQRLKSLGGKVTVATRSLASRYSAISDGFESIPLSEYLDSPAKCDVLFNTVPCRIIGENVVKGSNAVFIDLASAPGGFKKEAEAFLGDKLIKALALPGKYFPETAGEIIYTTIKNMLIENGG